MKRVVFYKGRPCDYKVTMGSDGERRYSIYENGILVHFVDEAELDRRPPNVTRMDRFLSNLRIALFA
jgi:hypothetical protein